MWFTTLVILAIVAVLAIKAVKGYSEKQSARDKEYNDMQSIGLQGSLRLQTRDAHLTKQGNAMDSNAVDTAQKQTTKKTSMET